MQADHECMYCGKRWLAYISEWKEPSCERCQDKQIRIRKIDATKSDVFGYKDDEARIAKLQAQERATALRASVKAAEELKKEELKKPKLFSYNRTADRSREYF